MLISVPTNSFDTITVKQLLDAVRAAEEQPSLNVDTLPRDPEIDSLLTCIDASVEESLQGRTLRQIAVSGSPRELRPVAARE